MGLNGSLFPGFYLPCCLLRTSNQLATCIRRTLPPTPTTGNCEKWLRKLMSGFSNMSLALVRLANFLHHM